MATPQTPYKGDEPYVFVCCSHKNEDVVFSEIAWLQSQGINVWYDAGIAAGKIWREEIVEALRSATHVLYFASADSMRSEHCRREVDFAVEKNLPVLPIYLEEIELPPEQALVLNRVQALRTSKADYREKLRRSLLPLEGDRSNDPIKAVGTPSRSRWISVCAGLVLVGAAAGLLYWNSQIIESPRFLERVFVDRIELMPGSETLGGFASLVRQELQKDFSDGGSLVVVVGADAADLLIQGTVRELGEGARVAIQLLRKEGGEMLWASEIDQLSGKQSFHKSKFVARLVEGIAGSYNYRALTPADDPAAQQAIQRGTIEWQTAGLGAGGDQRAAERYFLQAVKIEPGMAEAYGMLTMLYSNRLGGRLTAAEAGQKAHAAVRRQLEGLPDWTFWLGKLNMDIDLDYDAADANFRYASGNVPDNPTFVLNLGILSHLRGDLPGAIDHLETAIGLGANADSAWAQFQLGSAYLSAGMYDRALARLEAAQELVLVEPLYTLIERCRAIFHVRGGTEAGRCVDEGWALHGEAFPHWFPGILALVGRHDDARAIVDDMERQVQQRALPQNFQAFEAYFHLGSFDEAFVWLERAIDNREPQAIKAMRNADYLDPLRSDPRFTFTMSRLLAIEAEGSPTRSIAMQ